MQFPFEDCSLKSGGCQEEVPVNPNTRQGQILLAGDLNSGSGAQVTPG